MELLRRSRASLSALLIAWCVYSVPASAQLSGLVGYWTFEEGTGTTTADLAGSGFDGSFDNVAAWGGPTWTNSPLGAHALSFDGVNDRVIVGNPAALQLTGPITLSAWVYVRTFTQNGRIITKGGGSGQRGWALNVEGGGAPPNTGSFQVGANSTTTFSVRTATSIPSNQWIHLAGVYLPGLAMRIYTNGYFNNEVIDEVPPSHNNPALNVAIGARPTGGVDTPFDGLIDEVRVFNRALTEEEIRALPEVAQTPLSFVTEPVNRTIAQLRAVTFSAVIRGSPPYFFQWLSNGVTVAEATGPTFTIPSATLDMSGSVFAVTVSNLAFSITSSNAVLTVVQDTNPPAIISVGSADGKTIGVCFDEPADQTSAQDPFNYVINDGAVEVQSATLRPDNRSVALILSPPGMVTGTFTLKISYVQDLAGNEMPLDTLATGQAATLAGADLNSPAATGATFSCETGVLEITAGGDGIGGDTDQGHVALQETVGDFDLRVQVAELVSATGEARAGLMVRQTLEAGSPTLHLLATMPGVVGSSLIEAGQRVATDGDTTSWGMTFSGATLSEVWLRLRRAGDIFTGFYSTNGEHWVQMAQTTQVFSSPVLVGLVATANDNDSTPAVAQFRAFSDVTFSGASLAITQHPTDSSAELHSTVTFMAAAAGTGAPPSETVLYQWQRDDGVGGFTNIAAIDPTLTFLVQSGDHGARFRVRVYYAGLVEMSSEATLAVTPDITPPTLVSVVSRGLSTQVTAVFSEAISGATAEDPINYSITNELGVAVMVSAAILGADGRTVTLTVDPLIEGLNYTLAVFDLQDLGEPPNSTPVNTLAEFTYSSLVAYWPFEEGSGATTADQSGSGFIGTLLNGPIWVPGRVGNHALEFDGLNDRVDVGNPPSLQITGALTLATWVKVNSTADNGRIVTKGGGPGQRGWSLNVENIDAWAFQVAISGAANVSCLVTNIILNTWTHVAGVYDPAVPVMRLYTNGVLGGERTEGVPMEQFDSPLNVSIGARSVNQTWFDGQIDDMRIYTRALNDGEIAALAAPPAQFLPPLLLDGQVFLNWTGAGQLEWAPAIRGPWTSIMPSPVATYSEAIQAGANRFYRLNTSP